MGHRQAAGILHGFDLPGDPRRSLALHLVAPQGGHGLDQPARWVDLEDLPLPEGHPARSAHLEARARRPVRADQGAELVLAPYLAVGDRLPEALGRRADVDLEHLLHGILQSVLEVAERCRPGLGVFADPTVVDEPDRDRVQEVELLAPPSPGHHQAGLFELLQVLHHAEPRHGEAPLELAQRLAVPAEELVEEAPPGRIGKCPEHIVHPRILGDHLVTCQRRPA